MPPLIAAVFAALALCSIAQSVAPRQSRHDRQVIRFFLHHPRLADTPAGRRALWRVLGHVTAELRELQSARTIPVTGDWETAVRIVQRVYPGSAWWLLSCSTSEGGHGGFVMNTQGSGAGGWLQYMEGTFWVDFNAAVQDLHRRGVHVPKTAWSWGSPVGQALAGGWAYEHARWPGKWTGPGC